MKDPVALRQEHDIHLLTKHLRASEACVRELKTKVDSLEGVCESRKQRLTDTMYHRDSLVKYNNKLIDKAEYHQRRFKDMWSERDSNLCAYTGDIRSLKSKYIRSVSHSWLFFTAFVIVNNLIWYLA